MLQNATITRIDTATTSGGGERAWTNGPPLLCRCFLRDLDGQDKYDAGIPGALLEKEWAVIQVEAAELQRALTAGGYAAGFLLATEQRVAVTVDGMETKTYRIHGVASRSMGAISHRELTCMAD